MATQMNNINWTVEIIEEMRLLAAAGSSARQIAETLGRGISRLAVIGKCRRAGILLCGSPLAGRQGKGRPKTAKPKKAPKPRGHFNISFGKYGNLLAASVPPTPVAPLPELLPDQIAAQAVSFEKFERSKHCAWPVSDTPFLFCGGGKMNDKPYCAQHHARSLQKIEQRTRYHARKGDAR